MKKDVYELTNPQKSIWYTEQFYKGSSVNTICGTAYINEVVDFKLLKQAIKNVIENNPNFNIRFSIENKIPKQYFSTVTYNIEMISLSSEKDLEDFRKSLIKEPFCVENSSLYNFYIFQFPNKTGGFILNIHHLISDAWTLGLVSNNVISIYSCLKNNTPLEDIKTYSYLDFIENEQSYLKSDRYNKDKDYWNSLFIDLPEVATLPGTSNNKLFLDSCNANRKQFTFNKQLVETLQNFCKKNKVSLFNFFMAVFGVYISRICNVENFVIGTPILNRSNYIEKNTLGMFISTMPFKMQLSEEMPFLDFINNIAKDSMHMLRHQKYPYQTLLEDLRKDKKNLPNLYNILLSYQITNTKSNNSNIDYNTDWMFNGCCADPLDIHLYDLNDTGELNISYDYQTGIYTSSDIVSIHERILNLINQILEKPSALLKELEIVTPEEKEKLLVTFNSTEVEYDKNLTVLNLFEKQVKENPNKTALVSNGSRLTYSELNTKANQLAHYIENTFGSMKNKIIGIMINRSPEMIVGLLAILKSGATYLPIDPDYPEERISYMLSNSGTNTILVNSKTINLVKFECNKILVDLSSSLFIQNSNGKNLNLDLSTDSLAYLIYTSGSTGKPKGVMLSHNNLFNFVLGMKNIINFSPEKTMISLTTICFDIFGLELWCSLCFGLKLVLANEKEQNITELLNDLCKKEHVNMIQTTPSRYMNLLKDTDHLDFINELTDIMVGGEPLPKNLLANFKKISHANIYNMYGPTETTIWSTVKDMTNTDFIAVGHPIMNTKCYILDHNQKLLPPNTPGELYIGGDGVSKGYLNRNTLTNEKFIKSPFDDNYMLYNTNDLAYYTSDGDIVHLGRTDFQVKIRGYRIELEEIENRIIQYAGISNAVVTADKENKYLSCYYVSSEEIKIPTLISYLLKYLPNYMVPAYFMRLDKIPLTPNGKVDRKSLPDIAKNNDNIELAKTQTEKIISSAISMILHTNEIDINTPFLSLGLDSLGLIQLQTYLLSYNLNLTTQSFYKYPSIKRLARHIDSHFEDYKEFNFKIPSQFKHNKGDLDSKKSLINVDVLGNVLLTGANGFLGVHILHEILKSTNAKIYCFVRGKNILHATNRLLESYSFYFNDKLDDLINNRIFVYNGEITFDNFKLSDLQLSEITKNISTVIHAAAIVKHYGDYEQFKLANIEGTKRIVEFAYENKKRLIHISSISVSGNYLVKQDNSKTIFSENDLYIGQHYTNNVYVNSKFDAEKVVYSYMERGLTAEVLRIGILAGRYSDGLFQKNINENAFYGRIKSLVDLKYVSVSMLNQKIEFTPVDLCAKAIVLLSKSQATENRVFHLYDHNLTSIRKVVNILNSLDVPISSIDNKEFEEYLLKISKDSKDQSALKGIINDISFENSSLNLDYSFTVNISSKMTQEYLKALNFEWPIVDDNYLLKILKYMKKVKFI